MARTGSKEDQQAAVRVKAHFTGGGEKWTALPEYAKRKSFVQEIARHTQADPKLVLHVMSLHRLATGRTVGKVTGKKGTYSIVRLKGEGGELGCTCNDWRFVRSVAGDGKRECKHIRQFREQKAKPLTAQLKKMQG